MLSSALSVRLVGGANPPVAVVVPLWLLEATAVVVLLRLLGVIIASSRIRCTRNAVGEVGCVDPQFVWLFRDDNSIKVI